jgi:hypothetical protein
MDQNNNFFRGVHVASLLFLLLACLAGLLAAFAGSAGVVALAKGHPIQLIIAILATLGIGALLVRFQQGKLPGYVAALVGTGPLLSGAAAVITVVICLAGWPGREGKYVVLWGSAIAVWAWFVAAFVCRTFTDAEHAIPSSYGELRQRLTQLDAGLNIPRQTTGFPSDLHKTVPYHEAEEQRARIEHDLKQEGPSWVLGRGYINVWGRLHRAEEALIEVMPQETVLAGALYDELRLQSSKIENRDDLLAKLRQAVDIIDSGARKYLKASTTVTAPSPLAITTASPLPAGTVATAYSETLLATGGTPPCSWTVTVGMTPAGLVLDQKTGVLSGKPTKAGSDKFTVQVADSKGIVIEKSFTLIINPALAISTSPLPAGTVATAYPETPLATGGTPPYSWTVTEGDIPTGLRLDHKTGVLNGTPQVANDFTFTVQVIDSARATDKKSFTLRINPQTQPPLPLTITTASPLAGGTLAAAYSEGLLATGGTPPYKWTASQPGAMPDGLALTEAGVLSGTPTEAKTFNIEIQVADSASKTEKKLFVLTISQNPSLLHQSAANGPKALARAVLRTVRQSINEFRDESWNGLIVARNRLLATMFFTGLTVFALLVIPIIRNASQSAIVAASTFYLVGAAVGLWGRLRGEFQTEAAVEDYGLSAARLITTPLFSGLAAIGGVMLVAMLPYASPIFGPSSPAPPPPSLAISTNSPLPGGTVAAAYSETLLATGGTPPYKWTVSEGAKGAMPDALALSTAGVLSGTPTNTGTANFTVQVADSAGVTVEKRFALPINPPTQPPSSLAISTTSPLPGGTVAKDYSERLLATGGKPPYKWTLSLSQGVKGAMPAELMLSDAGVLSGKPTEAKTFDFTVRVTDSAGATADKSFTLLINQSEQAPAVAAAARVSSAARIPTLDEIFDLGKNLIGLFVAAVFGLTPGLLFDRLQQQAEKYKSDLKSSQATQGAQKT